MSFEDNHKFMGDDLFSIYFDFKTTGWKNAYDFLEDISVYPVFYAFVVAFHPELKLEGISIVRSFNDLFE